MNVGSICNRQVITASPMLDVQAAAELMRQEHVGFLVVVPERPRGPQPPLGVLTDRDIVVGVVAKGANPASLKVGDVMSMQPAVAAESDAIDLALRTMRRAGVRRLPVVNDHGEVVGVLSLDDLLEFLAHEMDSLSGAVRNGRRMERDART
ncbi:MAG: CBS domain-containing protein [Gammaproteobacteria bacterium]|nr:CBS domain-containing protein [Gammaproteobacteria bacterium]MDE2263436.1 CBS domain-containing protein [Gammaproteobacteria bacterium]